MRFPPVDPNGTGAPGSPPASASPADLASGVLRTFRTWFIVAVAGLLVIVVLLIGANRPANPVLLFPATGATGPLAFTEARIAVGTECMRVLVADTDGERARGLMGRTALDPYRGMLFVEPRASSDAFTMSGTLIDLTVAFYDASGHPIGAPVDMHPCPDDPEKCPRYHARKKYRFALETAGGQMPPGALGACVA